MDGLISIEIKAAVVRYHPDGGGYGSPWTWSCVIEQSPDDPALVDVTNVLHAAPRSLMALVARKLLTLGLGFDCWRHRIKGKWRVHDLRRLAEKVSQP